MECPFVIGQKVVAIKRFIPSNLLRVGDVYTIADIIPDKDGIWLRLADAPVEKGYRDIYLHTGFRPAIDLLAEFLASASRQKPRQKTHPLERAIRSMERTLKENV